MIQAIEERIARWTLLPVGNGEGLQVLRYGKTQKCGCRGAGQKGDLSWEGLMPASASRILSGQLREGAGNMADLYTSLCRR